MEKKKSQYMRLKELRSELWYWQMVARLDAWSLKATYKKCHEIGAAMREVQKKKESKQWRR
jgi:hypothetical protein